MGNLIKKVQKQKITYWSPLEANAHGEPQWGTPVEYTARVDAKIMQVMASDSTMVLSRYQLITQILLEVGGILVVGEMSGVSYLADPKNNPGAYEILAVSSTPDLRNRKTLFETFC